MATTITGGNWYKVGSVAVEQGSTTVTGSGTIWSTQARTGDMFTVLDNGRAALFYEILSVTGDTHLELVNPYQEVTAGAVNYAILRNFNTTMTSETNARLTTFIQAWNLALQQNLRGDKGDPGDDGNTIYSTDGAPTVGLGVDNDWDLDYSTWDMYRKEAGSWVLRGNIKGEVGASGIDGTKWFVATTDPLISQGITGDYALNTTSGDVYSRSSIGWTKVGNLKGAKGETGDQGPVGATGLTGATGTPGSKWYSVAGTPSSSLGINNDMAVDTATGNWYQKSGGAWSIKGNILGPVGPQGIQGIPGITWKGIWDVGINYSSKDGIYYNGSSYIAVQSNVGQTPPDPSTGGDTNWQVLARKGLDGTGAGDMLKIDYDADGDGKVDASDLADQATYAVSAGRATVADEADLVNWNNIEAKPTQFPPETHGLATHASATLAELNSIVSDATIPDNSVATTSANGLMSVADKSKIDGIPDSILSESDVIALIIALS